MVAQEIGPETSGFIARNSDGLPNLLNPSTTRWTQSPTKIITKNIPGNGGKASNLAEIYEPIV
jgi:hypothetical protein